MAHAQRMDAMVGKGIVVEFPTGRIVPETPRRRNDCIAELVRSIARGQTSQSLGCLDLKPLPIRLDLLSGIEDDTIAKLTELATTGIITTASAARLALKHAAQKLHPGARRFDPPARHLQHPEIVLTLVGDVFREYAFNLRFGEVWLGFAFADRPATLFEVCPPDRGSVCLVIGCDERRRNKTRLFTPSDWRRCLLVQTTKSLRTAHHVLVLGGIPPAGQLRSAILADLRRAVGARGPTSSTPVLHGQDSSARRRTATEIASQLLTLIEIAMPGLVDVPANLREHVG
jgi:hypothetical protein